MANGRRNGGPQLSWYNIMTTIGVVLTAGGAGWTLLQSQLIAMSARFDQADRVVTERIIAVEHTAERLNDLLYKQRDEGLKIQQNLYTTQSEFHSEIKRLDQEHSGIMKREEFYAWKNERDKTLGLMQSRQDAFTQALDAMYSRLIQHITEGHPK